MDLKFVGAAKELVVVPSYNGRITFSVKGCIPGQKYLATITGGGMLYPSITLREIPDAVQESEGTKSI